MEESDIYLWKKVVGTYGRKINTNLPICYSGYYCTNQFGVCLEER